MLQGAQATLIRNTSAVALYFGVYEIMKKQAAEKRGGKPTSLDFLIAGAPQTCAFSLPCCPTACFSQSMGAVSTLAGFRWLPSSVLDGMGRAEGLLLALALLRRRCECFFPVVLVAGAGGGVAYWLFTYPLDLVKSAMQTDAIMPADRKYKGYVDCVRKVRLAWLTLCSESDWLLCKTICSCPLDRVWCRAPPLIDRGSPWFAPSVLRIPFDGCARSSPAVVGGGWLAPIHTRHHALLAPCWPCKRRRLLPDGGVQVLVRLKPFRLQGAA